MRRVGVALSVLGELPGCGGYGYAGALEDFECFGVLAVDADGVEGGEFVVVGGAQLGLKRVFSGGRAERDLPSECQVVVALVGG